MPSNVDQLFKFIINLSEFDVLPDVPIYETIFPFLVEADEELK